ncbi:uncharacterized protein LOC130668530 [Microplitis mediator]|uniref:uncharacterized protein LOC130668530 n=1 Tax=Microplitis mediator TaxID=375433 RepID=UPI0025527777|nr:uncharacterized protein LOC130668530 [Microplitis mediator]
MISPNTPVYHVDLPENYYNVFGDKFTATEELDVFKATKAYKHYNNPDNDRSNTFVLNILLILDDCEGKNPLVNETCNTNRILQVFDLAARVFKDLHNPNIKLHISGVVKMKRKVLLSIPQLNKSWSSDPCYGSSTFGTTSFWLHKNSATFAKIDYDMFIFVSNERLCPLRKSMKVPSYFHRKNANCRDRHFPTGGVIHFGYETAELRVIQMIAERFGVRNDASNGCASDPDVSGQHFMDLENDKRHPVFRSWSECSKADFAKIIDDEKYECYKMPAAYDVRENQESGYKNLILGPNTYVHKIDFPHDNYVRVESDLNKFQATPAYNYYKNSDIDLSNTYVVNILLIYDWRLNEINKDSNILSDSILKKLDIVAANLNELQHVKIKLRISGIAIPQRSDIFDLPETQKMPLWEEPCYHSSASLRYLSNWLLENKDRFEDLSYDFFLFVTSRYFCDEGNENELKFVPSLKYDCNAAPTLVKSSGGLVKYDASFSLRVTQMIADRFNIHKDNMINCGPGHVMDFNKIENCLTTTYPRSWSDCSQSAFQSIISKEEYSCYKMAAFNPDSVDNDYQ